MGSISMQPYRGGTKYDEKRQRESPHDYGLCLAIRSDMMPRDDMLVLRSSEIVGHQEQFFYDDHVHIADPEHRGKHYAHTPFVWDQPEGGTRLTARCPCEDGGFSLELTANADVIDIQLELWNDTGRNLGLTDWAFCLVTYDSEYFHDFHRERTYVYDGERLVPIGSILGRDMAYIMVDDPGVCILNSFQFGVKEFQAKAPVIITESVDGNAALGLCFECASPLFHNFYCMHADPCFGELGPYERKRLKGRIYISRGSAHDLFERIASDFGFDK